MGTINSLVNPNFTKIPLSPRPNSAQLNITGNIPSYTGGTRILPISNADTLNIVGNTPSFDITVPDAYYTEHIRTKLPQAYWRYEETSGTVISDDTANNNDCTFNNTGVTYEEPGLLVNPINKRFGFSQAQNIYVDTPFDLVAPYTVIGIYNMVYGGFTIIGNNGNTFTDVRFNIYNRQVRFDDRAAGITSRHIGSVLNSGENIHVAITVDTGYNATVYMNGAQHGASVAVTSATLNLQVINSGTVDSQNKIDDLALFDYQLTPLEILTAYNADVNPPAAPIVIIGNVGYIETQGYISELTHTVIPVSDQLNLLGSVVELREGDKYFSVPSEQLSIQGSLSIPGHGYVTTSGQVNLTGHQNYLIWLNNYITPDSFNLEINSYNYVIKQIINTLSEQLNLVGHVRLVLRDHFLNVVKSRLRITGQKNPWNRSIPPSKIQFNLGGHKIILQSSLLTKSEHLNIQSHNLQSQSTMFVDSGQIDLHQGNNFLDTSFNVISDDLVVTGYTSNLNSGYVIDINQLNDVGNVPVCLISKDRSIPAAQIETRSYAPGITQLIPIQSGSINLTEYISDILFNVSAVSTKLSIVAGTPVVITTDIPYQIEYTDLYIIPNYDNTLNITISGLEFDTNVAQLVDIEVMTTPIINFECQIKRIFDTEVEL